MTDANLQSDECYRCGYDLRGIANDQACPECGLLAERSRRVTDELHETRPRWLRNLRDGVTLILIAIVLTIIGVSCFSRIYNDVQRSTSGGWLGSERLVSLVLNMCAGLLFCGVLGVTWREGYAPADLADRPLRIWLRLASLILLIASLLLIVSAEVDIHLGVVPMRLRPPPNPWTIAAFYTAMAGALPLPILLFLRLRGLAKRARSAHLAEHCIIVGVGTTTAIYYYSLILGDLIQRTHWRWSMHAHWSTYYAKSLVLALAVELCGWLFTLWSAYLLVRFAIAFNMSARQVARKWTRDDRSTVPE